MENRIMDRIYYSTEDYAPKPALKRIRNQKVIDKLLSLEAISEEQHYAGCQFYKDYYLANYYKIIKSRMIMVQTRSLGSSRNDLDEILSARQSYEGARSLLSSKEIEVIDWTVIQDEFLKYYGNTKEACHILRSGLSKLSKFYGVIF